MKKEMTIQELSDFEGSLEKLGEIIVSLAYEYGEESIIRVDAGYNNVDFILKTGH